MSDYYTRQGEKISISALSPASSELLRRIQQDYKSTTYWHWVEFQRRWSPEVNDLSKAELPIGHHRHPIYKILMDLSIEIGIRTKTLERSGENRTIDQIFVQ